MEGLDREALITFLATEHERKSTVSATKNQEYIDYIIDRVRIPARCLGNTNKIREFRRRVDEAVDR